METRTTIQVLNGALRILGVIGKGEASDQYDQDTMLEGLQDMLATWTGQGIVIPAVTAESITMVSGTVYYTIGENGSPSLNTVRPEEIVGAYIKDSAGYDHPVEVIGEAAYRRVFNKTIGSGRVEDIWYNPTVPNGTLYTSPPSNSSTDVLWMHNIKPLTGFEDVTDTSDNVTTDLNIPRNYVAALKFNLAVFMADEYGRPLTETMILNATNTFDSLIKVNAARRVQPADLEFKTVGLRYSILDG